MDLHLLQYVVEIANEGSISKAAQKLFISQPTLSIYLKKLENELGTPLFTRSHNLLTPTQAGEMYLDTARAMLQMKSTLYSRIGALTSYAQDVLSIGIFQNIGSKMIKSVYPAFLELYPDIRVDISDSRLTTLQEHLLDGSIHLAFAAIFQQRHEKLHYELIKKEEFVIAVSEDYHSSFPFEHGLSFESLRHERFILAPPDTVRRELEDTLLSQYNIIPQVHSTIHNIGTLLDIVADGQAISLIPKGFSRHSSRIRYVTLKEHPCWNLVAIYPDGKYLSEAEQAFIHMVEQYYKEHRSY